MAFSVTCPINRHDGPSLRAASAAFDLLALTLSLLISPRLRLRIGHRVRGVADVPPWSIGGGGAFPGHGALSKLTRARLRIRVERRVVVLCFDVDSSGIARTTAAQLIAYWSGIVFLVEELLTLVIRRPPAVATVILAGDPRIGSGSKCDAIGHCAPPPQGCCSHASAADGPLE